MHLQSLLAMALLASPLVQASKRAPVDETVVSANLFERYVASHLKSRKEIDSPEVKTKPAVFRPRKIDPPAPNVVARAPQPFVRPPGSHLAHAVWKPYTPDSALIASTNNAPKRRTFHNSAAKKANLDYRHQALERVEARKRGSHILNHASSLQKRSAKERPASTKAAGEWIPFVQSETAEEDWSWMNAGETESAEGDEESSPNLRKRSSAVSEMERRMRRGSSL